MPNGCWLSGCLMMPRCFHGRSRDGVERELAAQAILVEGHGLATVSVEFQIGIDLFHVEFPFLPM
jgi:hypothetical protein